MEGVESGASGEHEQELSPEELVRAERIRTMEMQRAELEQEVLQLTEAKMQRETDLATQRQTAMMEIQRLQSIQQQLEAARSLMQTCDGNSTAL